MDSLHARHRHQFEIVAHRGIPLECPENTIASFERAVELGADAIELDIRLTSDHIPAVFHYFYLQETTSVSGAIFDFRFEQLRHVQVLCKHNPDAKPGRIPTLEEILEIFGGKIGLEIEIKGPEPEAPEIIGKMLHKFKHLWHTIEVTSYEPALLLTMQKVCPGLMVDLLYPRSASWMQLNVVQYQAIHSARLAHARAVHLHPTQLSETMVAALHQQGIEIHAWDVNDEHALEMVTKCGIPRLCTDKVQQALAYRERLS